MIDPTENSIDDIKKLVETISGVPAANQELFLNHEKLSDNRAKATDCGVQPNTVLFMEPKSITISVEMPDGTKHEVQASPSDTTEQVKDKIAMKTGMAAHTQIIKFNGKEIPKGKTLKVVSVRNDDTLHVVVSEVPLTVKTKDGKHFTILVGSVDTVRDIKKKLEGKTGLPADQQVLCSEVGAELVDNNQSAADCGIKAGSILTLTPKSLKIHMEMPNGSKYYLEIDGMDSASDIQSKIAKTSLTACMVADTSGGTLEIKLDEIFGKK